jgi:hypothetical protein
MPAQGSNAHLERSDVERVMAALRKYHCESHVDRLVKAGADRDELLRRLLLLVDYSPKLEPRRLTSRETSAHARKIRDTADLIEFLNEGPHNVLLLGPVWQEALTLPTRLRELADRVQRLPEEVDPRWEPIKVAAQCQLVWVVKQATGRYHDDEVSALIGALLHGGQWDVDSLKQWRSRHATDIQKLGPLVALPRLPKPPRKYR